MLPRTKIKLFMDGADLAAMTRARAEGLVSGFTTNPTLMRKAGISDYEGFARAAIAAIPDLPISFEVFAGDFATTERAVRAITSWGGNVHKRAAPSPRSGVDFPRSQAH